MNKIKSHLISSKNPKSYKILKDLIDNSFNIVPATTSLGFAILCEKIKKDKIFKTLNKFKYSNVQLMYQFFHF